MADYNHGRGIADVCEETIFFSHAKSSAALVRLSIHAALIVVALSFVAVTVITKEEKALGKENPPAPRMGGGEIDQFGDGFLLQPAFYALAQDGLDGRLGGSAGVPVCGG